MKKLLAIVSSLVICVSFAACTNNDAKDNNASASAPASASADSSAKSGGSSEMEKFIDSIQSEIDQMTASMKSSGMDLKVTAKGNSLVYSFQFGTDIGDKDQVKEGLETALDSMASTFESVLTQLKGEVKSAESVVVEYLDKDGEIIASKEFK